MSYQQSVQFNGMCVVTLRWPDFKSTSVAKGLSIQYTTDQNGYVIFAIDGNIAYTTYIVKPANDANFPWTDPDYSQSQNDIDHTDFTSNFQSAANLAVVKLAATGVSGASPAKGLGGFVPDPGTNPYSPDVDEVVSLYTDSNGALVVRGQSFSDEGSLRDDFTGSSLESNLTGTVTFTNGSATITGSGTSFTSELNRNYYVRLSTDSDSKLVNIYRVIDDSTALLASPYAGSSASGTATTSRWLNNITSNGSTSVSSSMLHVGSGTTAGSIQIYRDADYAPEICVWSCSVSQRISNQTVFLGFRDDVGSPSHYCDVVMTGTDNTKITFRSAWSGDEQLTDITLPPGLNTSQTLHYKIDLAVDYCSLLVNGVLVAKHENHVPDMYASMYLCSGITNSSTVTATNLIIDTVYWLNLDQTQISTSFRAPISVVTTEDQHTVYGTLTTTLTTSNQTLISYSVPAGRVFYIIGYRVDTSGTSGGTVKIGRNDLSTEPASPGSVDSNVFRAFNMAAGGSTSDVEFGSNPRKLGVGGDTILVQVTPSAGLSTIWRAAVDFVLR